MRHNPEDKKNNLFLEGSASKTTLRTLTTFQPLSFFLDHVFVPYESKKAGKCHFM